jgi:hypothetical protein
MQAPRASIDGDTEQPALDALRDVGVVDFDQWNASPAATIGR